jgi:hypothetical protein
VTSRLSGPRCSVELWICSLWLFSLSAPRCRETSEPSDSAVQDILIAKVSAKESMSWDKPWIKNIQEKIMYWTYTDLYWTYTDFSFLFVFLNRVWKYRPGLKLTILLPQHLSAGDYRSAAPCQVQTFFLLSFPNQYSLTTTYTAFAVH